MAKQTFTTGSVLTATQMNNLQANDYNQTVSQKTASYVLAATDAGTRIEMNAAGSTTVTVNTGLFTAGDTLIIQNIGAGTCTVTAGTATVSKATNASLALAQYQGGTLYFVSASSAIFFPFDIGSAASGGLTQLYTSSMSGVSTITSSSFVSTAKQLIIEIKQARATSGNIAVTFNSDTGSNYYSLGFNSSAFNSIPAWSSTNAYVFSGQHQASDQDVYSWLTLPGYGTGNAIKLGQAYGLSKAATVTSTAQYYGQYFWNNSAAISTVTLTNTGATNWTAGTFTIWGLN